MIVFKNIIGTQKEKPLSVEVNIDTVYIRSNIAPYEKVDGNFTITGWQYDEIQYDKNEYIQFLADKDELKQVESRLLNADEYYKQLDKSGILLENLKQFKINQLKYLCSSTIYDGFTSPSTNHSFSFDEQAQANFTQQLLLIVSANGNYTDKIHWKTKSMEVVELSPAEFVQIVTEAKDFKVAQQGRYWQLEQQVLTATSNEEVELVVW